MQRGSLSSVNSMALGNTITPNLSELTLGNVLGEVPIEPQNHQIHASDILQQALEEASQNLVQSVERCEASPSNSIQLNLDSVCDLTSAGLLSNQKHIELSEHNAQEITIAFSESANGNVISIPETIPLDNLTVPVFTTEPNDAVTLALDNLPITAISEPVTLSLTNNSVTFPCNLDADTNGILTSTELLGNPESIVISSDKSVLSAETPEDLLDSITNTNNLSNGTTHNIESSPHIFTAESVEIPNPSSDTVGVLQATVEDALKALTLPPPKDTAAPIGSSDNPIQIVQHGSTYHSTQLLNPEQLAQIAQVLQQQQVSKSAEKGRSAVLYNPSTNTRIVYRVVYPSGVNANISSNAKKPVENNVPRSNIPPPKGSGRGRSRKMWSKKSYEDERKLDAPDLSREEKEERKKHRPRTRSGRISKPPSYMIKDYKRIHHLDFNEDPQNDTDGGYSDFHLSEEEAQNSDDKDSPNSLPPGVTTIKPRNYKCKTCDKAYIGRGGLARHYRLSSGHGAMSPEEEPSPNDNGFYSAQGASDDNSNMSENSQPLPQVPMSSTSTTPAPETQANDIPVAPAPPVTLLPEVQVLPIKNSHLQRNREQQTSQLSKKKAKLKELIQPYCDADLVEVVMPRLSQAITLWEFLVLKSEKGEHPSLPHIPDIFRHFEDLLNRLQALAQDCLVQTSSSSSSSSSSSNSANVALCGSSTSPPLTPLMADENKVYVEITNERVAQVLGVSTGLFEVVQWKLLQHVPSLLSGSQATAATNKRSGTGATDLLGLPSRKRTKKDTTTVSGMFCNNTSVVLPEDNTSLGPFPVEESSSLESASNLSASAAVLNKSATLHHASETVDAVDQFVVISSQSQDSNFSNSLDGSCHASSVEELPCSPISTTTLNQNLVFTTSSMATDTVDSTCLPKVNILKHTNLLGDLPGAEKTVPKVSTSIPSIRVDKVNLFSKESNLLSVSETEHHNDKPDSSLVFPSVQSTNGFLKESPLVSVNRTADVDREASKNLPTSVEVSSSFLSLLGETSMVMDLPIASLIARPVTVMSSVSSVPCIPPLDALLSQTELSQFRMSEESSELRDALNQAMATNQPKELEVPSAALTSTSDEMPVIQLVPESSGPLVNPLPSTTNSFETLEDSETVTRNLLSNNVVILQNEDGTTTLQLPTDQPLSLETLQALLAMDHNLAAEILRDDLSIAIDGTK